MLWGRKGLLWMIVAWLALMAALAAAIILGAVLATATYQLRYKYTALLSGSATLS